MSTYSDLLSVLSLFIAWLVAKPRSEAVHCRFFFFFFWAAKPHGWCKNWLVVFTMYGNVSFDHNLWRCSIRLFDDHENINLRLIFYFLFFLYSHERAAHGRVEKYFISHHNASVSAAHGSCCGLPHDCNKLWRTLPKKINCSLMSCMKNWVTTGKKKWVMLLA